MGGIGLKLVKRLIAICCAAIMAVSAAACGANVDSRTEITVWSWEPSMKQVIAGFEKENPDIHVIWKNTSGYDNLNNAIQDGYGIPDVVQLEYYALRQYAVSSQLMAITGLTKDYGDFARHMGFGAAERPRVRPAHGFRPNGVLLQQKRVRPGRR